MSQDKAQKRWQAKQASADDAVLNRPTMVQPSGKAYGVRPQTITVNLSPSMVEAGWTVDSLGNITPPVKADRGNAQHVSETTKARQQRRKAEKSAKRKATIESRAFKKAEKAGEKPATCEEEGKASQPKEKGSADVAMTLHYVSGLKRAEVAEGTESLSPLDHARKMAITFLLESNGEGMVLRVTIHGPRTGDETHTRDQVKAEICQDRGIFDWAAYLGRFRLGEEDWTPGERVQAYLKDNRRTPKGPICQAPNQGHRFQRDKESRSVFPKHSPAAYVGDWRSPKA